MRNSYLLFMWISPICCHSTELHDPLYFKSSSDETKRFLLTTEQVFQLFAKQFGKKFDFRNHFSATSWHDAELEHFSLNPKLLHFLRTMSHFSSCPSVHLKCDWFKGNRARLVASSRCCTDGNVSGCRCGFQPWPLLRRVSQPNSSPLSLYDRHTNAPQNASPLVLTREHTPVRLPPLQPSTLRCFPYLNNVSISTGRKRQCLHFSHRLAVWMLLPFFFFFTPTSENRVQKKAVAMVIHPLALPGTFLATRCARGGFSSPVTFL